MSELARLERGAGGIATVVLDHPPINALDHPLRQAMAEAFRQAETDPSIGVIVLAAAGRTFPAGADSNELERRAAEPTLGTLCLQIEACSKPVVAAVHGTALGDGLELALAAHYRIADAHAYVGLPEINLGLPPRAGGSQRLPRMTGAAVALEMLLVGRPVAAAEAQRLGIIDRIAEAELRAAADAYARELLDQGAGPRPSRDRTEGMADPIAYQEDVARYRDKTARSPLRAPARIVDCVEAAQLLPFEAGLLYEETAFEECLATPEAKSLRHAFMAERLVGHLHEFEGQRPRPLVRAAVAGARNVNATAAWGALCLDGGLQLSVQGADADLVETRLAEVFDEAVRTGRLADGHRGERLARLVSGAGPEVLAEADLVIVTDPDQVAPIEAGMRPGAVLAIVTRPGGVPDFSMLDRPEDALGLQVTGPANSVRLVEVLTGEHTATDAVLTVVRWLRKLKKVPVISPAAEGGIGAAIWGAGVWAAEAAVLQGVPPEAVEAALKDYGFRTSPLAGRRMPVVTERGNQMPAEQIQQRIIAAMANAGALLIEAGIARRPADIDMAMVHGYGFPAWHGGPMEAADLAGLLPIQNTLKALSAEDTEFWLPSGLFGDLIKNGRKFTDLNRI